MSLKPVPISEDASPQERYVFKPMPGSSHTWALEQLSRLPTTARVLDIGSGSGAVGAALKAQGVETVDAVEIDAAARAHVKAIYNNVEASLESYAGRKYDAVLMLDVLEHMTDPKSFLTDVASYVSPGGFLLISVPNVAHWSVRLFLLWGKFDYTERGILDKTHFHFFTQKHLHQMINGIIPLSITHSSASVAPYEFLLPPAVGKSAAYQWLLKRRISLAHLFPGLLGYQHLVRAVKKL